MISNFVATIFRGEKGISAENLPAQDAMASSYFLLPKRFPKISAAAKQRFPLPEKRKTMLLPIWK